MEKTNPSEIPEKSGIEKGGGTAGQKAAVSCAVVPAEQSRSFADELNGEWHEPWDRIGGGIEGVITRNEVAHALIYKYDIAFFLDGGKWILSSNVAQGTHGADCVIEMSHDMSPDDYDDDYTVTDMIQYRLDDAVERLNREGGF